MKELFTAFLLTYSKKTISLHELENFSHIHKLTYQQFAKTIVQLENDAILEIVKAKGRTIRKPNLGYAYRVNNAKLKGEQFHRLQQARFYLDKRIKLDKYFKLHFSQFEEDEPCLIKISDYLKNSGFPISMAPAPERSFELVGNEKWITDEGGVEVLKRIELWDELKIFPVADPLMLAVDGNKALNSQHSHLIVENKTTYQGLLPVLKESLFTTLIYGSGRKILKGIEQFHDQVLIDGNHRFFYFGDIDLEGISIWYELTNNYEVELALPFYEQCLKNSSVAGKTNQRRNERAIESFRSFFSRADSELINMLLVKGHYLPQEVLKTNHLQKIWRQWS